VVTEGHSPLTAIGTVVPLGAMVPALFAYGGWQSTTSWPKSSRTPSGIAPRAGDGNDRVVVCYVGANIVYLRVLGR